MSLSPAQRDTLLDTLLKRFFEMDTLHPDLSWDTVRDRLAHVPIKLAALHAMETTGGQPNVVSDPTHPSSLVFMDCAAESPAGRRSLCYDREALLSRKSHPPKDSVQDMAAWMGIKLLSEAQYRALQALYDFDMKTSSWIQTPIEVRNRGGALFCDKRYGQVFVYHNGAESYYSSRGFRGYLVL